MGTMSNETLSRQLNHRDIWYSEGWEIQRNIAQSYESKTHVVTWSRSGTISEVEANRRGCGTGAGFLLALIPGDRIAVIARAMVRNCPVHVLYQLIYVRVRLGVW